MKILLATYSAESHTSYGRVTREIWSRLRAQNPDWQIMQHGWFHQSMQKVNWHIEPTLSTRLSNGQMAPNNDDRHGRLSFPDVVKKFQPDVVWTLSDPFMCDYMGQYKPQYGFKLIKHCPVDGAPQPNSWKDAMKDCDLFVPITQYGSDVLEPIFGRKLPFIYHGVDVDKFVPVAKDDPKRMEARKSLGATDETILFGFVGHNQPRKQTWNMFPLIRYLRDGAFVICDDCHHVTLSRWNELTREWGTVPTSCRHCLGGGLINPKPVDARLWYHCFDRKAGVAWPIEMMQDYWRLSDYVVRTKGMGNNTGIPDDEMPALYQALDGYLCLSGAEGFCLPVVEAAACGVPNLYVNYSAHAETAAIAGLPVRYSNLIPELGETMNRAIVDMEDLVAQGYIFCTNRQVRQELSRNGIQMARDTFSLDIIAQQWSALIRSTFSAKKYKTVGMSI